jgi:putative DNA primase/helicase
VLDFELPELSQMRKTDIEALKAFLTREVDKYRPPYARYEVEFPRMCILVGTTNDDTYLKDSTGNRRFLPVLCGGPIDLKKLKTDRDQIWAEAVTRYKGGQPWHTTDKKIVDILEKVQEQRTITDPWEAAIIRHLEHVRKTGAARLLEGVTPGEILEHELGLDVSGRHKGNAHRVAQILAAQGWKKKAPRHWKRGSIYLPP